MKLPTLSRRFWIACSTLAVIGAMFAYYLLVYVAKREDKLREEKYRALARYGDNMVHKRVDYYNAIQRNWRAGKKLYWAQRNRLTASATTTVKNEPKTEGVLDRLYRANKNRPCQSCDDVYYLAKKVDSLENIKRNDAVDGALESLNKSLTLKLDSLVKVDLHEASYNGYYRTESQVDDLQHEHFDRVYFAFPGTTTGFGVFSIATKDFAYKPDQFDEFFIIKKYDESRHEHGGKKIASADDAFQTFSNRVDLRNVDSLMIVERGLLTSRFEDVKLADARYKLFVHAIEFAPGEDWILCGLMKTDNFNRQIRSVDPFVITTAVLLVLFLVIAMPILKLRLMNSFERLTKVNVWFAGFSVVCGSAILLLIIWSLSDNVQTHEAVVDSLANFSGSIKNRFETELGDIYDQLEDADAKLSGPLIQYRNNLGFQASMFEGSVVIVPKDTLVRGNLMNVLSNPGQKGDDSLYRLIRASERSFRYPYFNFLIWVDSHGTPLITLSNKDIGQDYPMPKIDKRKYFSWAMHDSLWYLPKSNPVNTDKRFTLQSIWSWIDHDIEACLAMPLTAPETQAERVLMIATRLYSVMNPLMQPGYGFCILDETGEVWFHSDPNKNHQQNFINETNQKNLVQSAIVGRLSVGFDGEYEDKRCQFHMQPIDNVPLYLVVFHDDDYQRTPVVLTLFFTFILGSLFFVLQGLQLLILFLCEWRPGMIRSCQSQHFLYVLRPNNTDSLYRYAVAAQLIVLIICVGLYFFNWDDISVGVVFISLPLLIMCFQQAMLLKKWELRMLLFQCLSAALLIAIDALAFKYLGASQTIAVAIVQIVVAGLLFTFVKVHEDPSRLKLPILITCKDVLFSWGDRMVAKFDRRVAVGYIANLFLWLMLISLLPVSFFYKITREHEGEIWNRYEQLEASKAEFVRLKTLDEKAAFLNGNKKNREDVNKMGRYVSWPTVKLDRYDTVSGELSPLDDLLFAAWPRLSNPFGISSATVSTAASDGKWSWEKSDMVDVMKIRPDYRPWPLDNDNFAYVGGGSPFSVMGGRYGFWFVLLIILCLAGTVWIIWFCTKYIFGVGFIPQDIDRSRDVLTLKIQTTQRLFVVGFPCSGKTTIVKDVLKNAEVIDFQLGDEMVVSKTDATPCVIRHFEYGINDHALNQKKLAFLRDLLKNPDRKIVVLSAHQPGCMVDVYRKWIADMKEGDDKEKDADSKKNDTIREYKVAIRNWKDLFGEFEVFYKSIYPTSQVPGDAVAEELNSCYYLQMMATKPEFQQVKECNDDFILHVQEVAEPYYQSLWSALSHNEKLFLADLARDGFVNLKCRTVLRMLMQKGLIVERKSLLELMNDSFRHFVIEQFKQDDEVEVAKQIEKKGAWSSIRIVLIIVLVAIVVFIALAQEQLFKNINAFVVALGSAAALLTRFGGIFSGGSKGKE